MAAPKKPRVCVEHTIEKKREILDDLNKGFSLRKVAEKHGVPKSTVSSWKRETILNAYERNVSDTRKRSHRSTPNDKVNDAILEFFRRCRSKNITISGPMLQAKARDLATSMNVVNFTASNGWLEAWRKRNNIQFRELSGNSADADVTAASDWKRKLPDLIAGYSPCNIFNADETAFFYRQLPTASLVEKGEKCKGGRLAKERVSIMLCCSATGEKFTPLIIGKSAFPRAFKDARVDVSRLPCYYYSNSKAWMNRVIFTDFLRKFNNSMRQNSRKVLLIIDNASSHIVGLQLSNVKLLLLPPNLTSELQPLDQGIIRATKLYARKSLLEYLIAKADQVGTATEFCKSVTVLHAIRWICKAWEEVKTSTIQKCFCKTGFPVEMNVEEVEELEELQLYAGLESLPYSIRSDLQLDDNFGSFDDNLDVHDGSADNVEDIAAEILEEFHPGTVPIAYLEEDEEDEIGDQEDCHEPVCTYMEAEKKLQDLLRFAFVSQPNLIQPLMKIQGKFESDWAAKRATESRQSSIRDFMQ